MSKCPLPRPIFSRTGVEIIEESRVWTGIKNCISIVSQGSLHNIE